MPIIYKINVLDALKAAGYNTRRIREERLLAESTLQAFRKRKPISWANLNTLCSLLNCQPGDIIEHIPDEPTEQQEVSN